MLTCTYRVNTICSPHTRVIKKHKNKILKFTKEKKFRISSKKCFLQTHIRIPNGSNKIPPCNADTKGKNPSPTSMSLADLPGGYSDKGERFYPPVRGRNLARFLIPSWFFFLSNFLLLHFPRLISHTTSDFIIYLLIFSFFWCTRDKIKNKQSDPILLQRETK